MITIKKPHNIYNNSLLNSLINQYSNIVRFSYNRKVKDGIINKNQLEQTVKQQMNNIDLDASWIKAGVKKADEIKVDGKLYFGGKKSFFKRKYHKINSYDKSIPLDIQGETNGRKGNRKANLDIENNQLIFKPFRGEKINIPLKLSKNEKQLLSVIQERCENNEDYFNIKIDSKFVYISFNEPNIYQHNYKKNRFLGIDLNPNYIALSIMDKNKEVYKEIIDLKTLNKQSTKNKKKYELTQVNKYITNLAKGYNVEYVCLEDINIKSKNNKKGKHFNKLVNNDWDRNYTTNNLCKWLTIYGIKYLMVNPYYTSFIGQMKYESDYDSIAASKEVAYRGYLKVNNYNTYDYIQSFLGQQTTTHWKKMLNVNTYKDVYNYFKQKKSKNSYRFLFNDVEKERWSCFSLKSQSSMVDLIRF